MIRALPYLVAFALVVYCLIDAIQTPSATVRVLPRLVWMIVIIVIPFLGPLAWLVAGRPKSIIPSTSRISPTTTQGPMGPDDDPDYLRRLSDDARREQRARDRAADGDGSPASEEPGSGGS